MRASGSFSTAVEDLSKKALKVIFMIKRKFHCTHNNTPLLLKLFDSCVKPVLLYGSELWGPYILNLDKRLTQGSNDDLEKTFLNFAPEKVHIRYCKYVLGATKYALNIASMAELGRYPISIFVILQSLKYWLYLYKDPLLNFSKLAYKSIEEVDCTFPCTFNKHIFKFLKLINFDHVWNNKGTMSEGKLISAVKKILQERYGNYFFSCLSGEKQNKLRTYYKLKEEYKPETYTKLNIPKQYVRQLCKLRISNHNLHIEKGRYNKTPLDQRICTHCIDNKIEDEFHFICECNLYHEEREKFYDDIVNIIPCFCNLDNFDKFKYLMNCSETDVLTRFLIYIDKCILIRHSSVGIIA